MYSLWQGEMRCRGVVLYFLLEMGQNGTRTCFVKGRSREREREREKRKEGGKEGRKEGDTGVNR